MAYNRSGEEDLSFVHLHNHSQYSVIDGHGRIKDYLASAQADGQHALAITDHGTIAGAIEFYTEAKKAGIKPIIGAELYVDLDSYDPKEDRFPPHLTVLAKNLNGYRDLVEINSWAHRKFYQRPRVSLRHLIEAEMLRDLIILTGCPSSSLSKMLLAGQEQEARLLLETLTRNSAGCLIEIMYHTTEDSEFRKMQSDLLHAQMDLAQNVGCGLVLTNDCHYVTAQDEQVHQEFLKRAEGRIHGIEFDGGGFYLKTQKEMRGVSEHLGHLESWDNTGWVADQCELSIPEVDSPKWYVPTARPEITDTAAAIRAHCETELADLPPEYRERFEHEISVIQTSIPIMNSYIVAADLVGWCRQQGIPATGRGSMAGSLVSYLLGITSEDPVKFGLNFRRAVNPARLTIPDFDIDVSSARRDEVLSYIASKYPHSSPIASYSERGIRGATRMVMRALNHTAEYTNEVAKSLPEHGEADLEPVPEDAREVIRGYLGLFGNMTVHPAGILISGEDRPLEGMVPMAYVASSKQIVTQYDMYSLKLIDMFKLDVLGLWTLDAMAKMKELTGEDPPEEYDAPEVLQLLSAGLVCEIFQMDGFAARAAIKTLGISSFEDIVAINALVRPGASQFIPSYHTGDNTLRDAYPPVDSIVRPTRGLLLYQEQVMEIAEVLAGFDDLLQDDIKEAIKYFRADVFAELEPKFMAGCQKNGHDGALIWEAIKAFAGYAFNRAHAVTYAATAYKMAWYKKYFPEAFYTAVYDRADSKIRLILESLQLGVNWQLPDINESYYETHYEPGRIVLGLGAIKGIGTAVGDAVASARASGAAYTSLDDLTRRVKKQKCNIRHKALLQEAGALQSIGLMPEDQARQTELLGFNPSITDQEIATAVSIYENFRLGGFLAGIKEHYPKGGGKVMGFATVINAAGEFRVTLFHDAWKKFKKSLKGQPDMLPIIFIGRDTPKGFIGESAETYG